MSNANLKIELVPKLDKSQKTFYVGKLQGPFQIDCQSGIVFMIFVSENGEETLQICNMRTNDKDNYDK